MIDFGKILKRAWNILWNYRTLWIFGVLLALTSGGGGGNSANFQAGGDGQSPLQPDRPLPQPVREFLLWLEQNVLPLIEHPGQHISTIIWIAVGVFLFLLVVGVLTALVRYPSETALLRMVDAHEQSGEKLGFRAGWRLGWTRRAFRLWVIDLLISLPFILLVVLLAGLILFMVASVEGGRENALLMLLLGGVTLLLIFGLIVLAVLVSVLRQFFARKAALEGTGVGESLREGWAMFRRHWKSTAVLWLIMLAVGLVVGFGGLLAFFLLIPAYVILLLPAAIVAAVPGLITYFVAALFAGKVLSWILAILVALPFFVTVVFAPLVLIGGWVTVFSANVWTLAYREMKALEGAPAA